MPTEAQYPPIDGSALMNAQTPQKAFGLTYYAHTDYLGSTTPYNSGMSNLMLWPAGDFEGLQATSEMICNELLEGRS